MHHLPYESVIRFNSVFLCTLVIITKWHKTLFQTQITNRPSLDNNLLWFDKFLQIPLVTTAEDGTDRKVSLILEHFE